MNSIPTTTFAELGAGLRNMSVSAPRRLSGIWRAFAWLYLMGAMGVFSALEGPDDTGISLTKILFPPLYAITLVLVLARWRALWQSGFPFQLAALFTGLFMSALFCYRPLGALIPTFTLMFNAAFAWWLAQEVDPEEFATLLIEALLLMLGVAVLLAAINPQYVVFNDRAERANVLGGLLNIKGAFPHKIHAAVFNSIGALLAGQRWRASGRLRWLALSLLFTLLVLISGSSLGIVTLGCTLIAMPVMRWGSNRFGLVGLVWFLATAAFVLFVVIAYDLVGSALSAVGRDATLTGRTVIWHFGVGYIADHPWFGGGLGVFFLQLIEAPAYQLWLTLRWYVAPSFHNGYIQALAECGIVGATAFMLLLGWALSRLFRSSMAPVALILLALTIANTAASLFLASNSFFVLFLVYLWCQDVRTSGGTQQAARGSAANR